MTPLKWSPMTGGTLGLSVEAAALLDDHARTARVLRTLDEIAQTQNVARSSIALA